MTVYAVTYSVFHKDGTIFEGIRGIYSTREKAVESAKEGCQTYADLYGGIVTVDNPAYLFEFYVIPSTHHITEVVFEIDEVTVE